jgi:hypothetical protein
MMDQNQSRIAMLYKKNKERNYQPDVYTNPPTENIKQVQVKTANKSIRVMKYEN